MRALVFGRTGQVARALAARAGAQGIDAVCLGRAEIDVLDADAVAAAVRDHGPAVVINAAAYTAVDQAEKEPEAAFALNETAAAIMAKAAADGGAPFLHLSTDYVFPGDKPSAYVETDPTGPQGVYGASKLAGEQAVLAAHSGAVVLRTAWVYDATGKNFVRTMLRLAKARPEVGVVADQVGCPSFADDIADGLYAIAQSAAVMSAEGSGVFHMAGAGEVSWAGFAAAIFEESAARGGASVPVKPIATSDYPTPAKRPANSRLNCAKLAAVHKVALPDWREGLKRCMHVIAADGWRVE